MANSPSGALIRASAARALKLITLENKTIDWVSLNRPQWLDTPLSQELVYGVLRHHFSLSSVVNSFLNKPLRNKDRDVYELLLVGAYQLKKTRIPNHAVINESVAALVPLQKPWAKGLVNAVLRKITAVPTLSEKIPMLDTDLTDKELERSFDHQIWLVSRIGKAYGKHAQSILLANNSKAPMSLRVNNRLIDREKYAACLDDADIGFVRGTPSQNLVIETAQTSASLPNWAEGFVAVQDAGAQFAAELLLTNNWVEENHPSQAGRILDACAAPGGKLAHLFEVMPSQADWEILGVDNNSQRLETTQKILQRLGHEIPLKQGDVRSLDWWDEKPFTHVLLDAPCSGTGTLRRHPDIKLLLKESSIPMHQQLQCQILQNLWQVLTPGGTLLYCTCSLLEEENDAVIEDFMTNHSETARVVKFELPTGVATHFGWQLLPSDPNTDGFYYALLHKN